MINWESKNYYELLGVPKTASRDQIRQAYRDIALVYHPDSNFFSEILGTSTGGGNQELFKRITAAYHILMNQESREAYDRSLPPELPAWSNARRDPIGEKLNSYGMAGFGPDGRPSGAFGVFGRMQNHAPSVFEPIFKTDLRPVSELIKTPRRRGMWQVLRDIIGL